MKWILIQNDGEIEINSFELIGASTKRNETGKIGFFGSGLKYSLAYMMRNEIKFRIFSGEQEIHFSTKQETLKNQTFERICINGVPTSYTTTMGPTWKEDWFVLREIYCNALDETNCQIVKSTEEVNPANNKTRIYIELTSKLQDVINNWDAYFSDERAPMFKSKNVYASYIGTDDGKGSSNRQEIKVFEKTEGVLYRRGIRVYTFDRMLYDYELQYCDINEDRTAKHPGSINYAIGSLVGRMENEEYVKTILRNGMEEKLCREYYALDVEPTQDIVSEKWVQFSLDNLLVVREVCGRYTEQINKSKKEVFLLPSCFARSLKNKLSEIKILGMGQTLGRHSMEIVERTPKMEFLLKEVLHALKQMNYEVHYEIKIVQFDDVNVMGQADLNKKEIFLAAELFDEGRRGIAMTIMEETEHIVSQYADETRSFQTHLLSGWLTALENANALFL